MTTPKLSTARIEDLRLDPLNPRLPGENQGQAQDELLRIMARDYSLLELARSFTDNGYFVEEPLIVVPEDGTYLVVEGNRRLAALKLLSAPSMVTNLGLGKDWTELAPKWVANPIEFVPILIYQHRRDVVPYVGFRHISGVKPWEAREKARFIDALLASDDSHTFADVAREIGSRASSVRDSYIAYRLVRQAREQFEIDTSKAEDSFGVLIRAIASGPIKDHLGLSIGDKGPKELKDPLPPDRVDQTREIIGWIFGTDDRKRVITDSRALTKFGWILANAQALEMLRTSGNFDLALAQTEGEEKALLENLQRASYYLDQVKRDVDRHGENDLVRDLIDRCQISVRSIAKLAGKPEV